MIPYARQDITQADIDAVVSTLTSSNLTQGPQIPLFEEAIRKVCKAKYVVATNSATSALHISCLALGLGPGDWLWTTPNTFVASANCALYCGAQVDFVDIDPRTYNLCEIQLEKKLIKAEKLGKLPKIVVPVHFSGQPCNMAAIHALSQRYGFRIIEDAAHAIGGKYKDEPIGNCRYSDITIFSFHPVKIVTTAEGGAAVTNSPQLSERIRLLRSHGITRDAHLMTKDMDGPWYYQQVSLGFNYRMTDLQAALGVSQIQRIHAYVAKRHALARRYDALLQKLPVTTPWQHPDSYSGLHLYVIRLQLAKIKKTHLEIFNGFRNAGILVNLHYIPVHTQPHYQTLGFKEGQFPQAEQYYREAISIPMYPTLTDAQQHKVVETLTELLA